jgi:hypothetical protein
MQIRLFGAVIFWMMCEELGEAISLPAAAQECSFI